MSNKEFGQAIIDSLISNPEEWSFSQFYAVRGSLHIWIANRKYADLTIGSSDQRVGPRWQRRIIRKLMDSIRFSRLLEPSETSISKVLGEIERHL